MTVVMSFLYGKHKTFVNGNEKNVNESSENPKKYSNCFLVEPAQRTNSTTVPSEEEKKTFLQQNMHLWMYLKEQHTL